MKPKPDPDHQLAAKRQAANRTGKIHIPVVRERLAVSKRNVDTGRGVRVHKTVEERTEVFDIALQVDELRVEHVPMDVLITDAPLPVARYEGTTLIVPVLEEVVRVEKQWRLKEEVRITRHQRQRQASQSVVVRSENVSIERFEEPPAAGRPISLEGESS